VGYCRSSRTVMYSALFLFDPAIRRVWGVPSPGHAYVVIVLNAFCAAGTRRRVASATLYLR
jgi:hypothetical protein